MAQNTTDIHRAVDRYIYRCAASLIERHGEAASAQAARKARRLEAAGDAQASAVWKWIHLATVNVLKKKPDPGQSIH